MAAKNKTAFTNANVTEFINTFVDSEKKKQDSFQLVALMLEWTGCEPKMYGPSIIGFGRYQYKYASGHGGEAPIIGFSPRKAAFSLYVTVSGHENKNLLDSLGKYKMSKACIYFKKLHDLDIHTLEKICKETFQYMQANHACKC